MCCMRCTKLSIGDVKTSVTCIASQIAASLTVSSSYCSMNLACCNKMNDSNEERYGTSTDLTICED